MLNIHSNWKKKMLIHSKGWLLLPRTRGWQDVSLVLLLLSVIGGGKFKIGVTCSFRRWSVWYLHTCCRLSGSFQWPFFLRHLKFGKFGPLSLALLHCKWPAFPIGLATCLRESGRYGSSTCFQKWNGNFSLVSWNASLGKRKLFFWALGTFFLYITTSSWFLHG